MIDAQLLAVWASGTGTVHAVVSRKEDNVRVVVELLATDLGKVGVELVHKASEDVGDGTVMTGKIEVMRRAQQSAGVAGPEGRVGSGSRRTARRARSRTLVLFRLLSRVVLRR
ncbi:MAG: hypothetical protein IPK26_31910 [Planctomycetes bacterium]|nr:hypothetical protein [Planctomycetota bacterium]